MSKILMTIYKNQPITENEDGSVTFIGGMNIDADGSSKAYAPKDSGLTGLDFLANAGSPGNWYGIVTLNGQETGEPYVQGPGDPHPGFYVSPTAYQNSGFKSTDPRKYLDSENVAYVVVPGLLRKLVDPVVLGCKAIITNLKTGQQVEAVVGDTGPSKNFIPEASIKTAHLFGLNANPKGGGYDKDKLDFKYEIFPGIAAMGFELKHA